MSRQININVTNGSTVVKITTDGVLRQTVSNTAKNYTVTQNPIGIQFGKTDDSLLSYQYFLLTELEDFTATTADELTAELTAMGAFNEAGGTSASPTTDTVTLLTNAAYPDGVHLEDITETGTYEFEEGLPVLYKYHNDVDYVDESITTLFLETTPVFVIRLEVNNINQSNPTYEYLEQTLKYLRTDPTIVYTRILSSEHGWENGGIFGELSNNSVGGSSNNFIPLTGTSEGNPVNGDIILNSDVAIRDYNYNNYLYLGANTVSLASNDVAIILNELSDGENGVSISLPTNSFGLKSNKNHSEIDPENKLIYAQRQYVDNKVSQANSYSTDETLTGGNWIDDKPIYKKVIEGEVNGSSQDSIDLALLDIDYVLPIKGNCKDASDTLDVHQKFNISRTQDGPDDYLIINNFTLSTWSYIIVLEYTKTTD